MSLMKRPFMTRPLRLALAAATLLALSVPLRAAEITFVLVNDLDRASVDEPRGGFAKVAGAIAAERAKGGTVIVVHAGDAISPSLLSGIDKGAHIVELLNLIRFDVFVPGNHEYDFGKDIFLERMKALDAGNKLAANLRLPDGSPVEGFADTATLKVDDITVGIVGLTAEHAYAVSSPGDLKIAGTTDTGIAAAKSLRAAGADIVVAVAHASRGTDIRLLHSGAFDVILSGDDHDLLVEYDGRTVLTESREQGAYLPVVTLDVTAGEADGKRRVTWTPSFRIVDTADVAPDPKVAAKVAELEAKMQAELGQPIATTETELDSRRPAVRGGEAAIGNVIADAMKEATGADAALMNGGGIRANKLYPAGSKLSRGDVFAELPFGNVAVVLELKGSDLKAALENGVSAVEEGAGRFPQVSGMRLVVDASKPKGERVVSVEIAGAALDPAKTYRIVTNDFMARGGDGYVALREGKPIVSARDGRLLATVVADWLAAKGTVAVKTDGRVTLTGG